MKDTNVSQGKDYALAANQNCWLLLHRLYMSATSHHSKKPECTKRPNPTNQPINKQTNKKENNNKKPQTKSQGHRIPFFFFVDSHVHSIGRSQMRLFSKII